LFPIASEKRGRYIRISHGFCLEYKIYLYSAFDNDSPAGSFLASGSPGAGSHSGNAL
jgi:hypothetical protein